ncbi:Uncharacterised protein [Mycoplasmopsis columboralis]|uniref:Uncharacterized protein n=2 Tax=Mycoplasmopsis columboralis TaxID=171282 RepID=A0A449B6I9_9BACT|nr:Uncharacterised protein [Mycoplasmopsis columboralis]
MDNFLFIGSICAFVFVPFAIAYFLYTKSFQMSKKIAYSLFFDTYAKISFMRDKNISMDKTFQRGVKAIKILYIKWIKINFIVLSVFLPFFIFSVVLFAIGNYSIILDSTILVFVVIDFTVLLHITAMIVAELFIQIFRLSKFNKLFNLSKKNLAEESLNLNEYFDKEWKLTYTKIPIIQYSAYNNGRERLQPFTLTYGPAKYFNLGADEKRKILTNLDVLKTLFKKHEHVKDVYYVFVSLTDDKKSPFYLEEYKYHANVYLHLKNL